jgi:hypothetical protein
VDHHTPAVSPLAPSTSTSRSPSSSSEPASWLERHIGECVAAAGGAIVAALDERRDGALTPRTKGRGGELIFEVYRLRQFLIADFPDFDTMARTHGVAALRAATDGNIRLEIADELVNAVLDILQKVVKSQLN